MNNKIAPGKNCILTRLVEEDKYSDRLEEGERVVVLSIRTFGDGLGGCAFVKNRIGSTATVDLNFLIPAPGRPMKVMV